MDPQQAQVQAMHAMMVMLPFMMIGSLIGLAIVIIPFWQIFKKAGMSGALSLLMALPIINIVMLYVLAFAQWKVVPVTSLVACPPAYPPPPPAYPPAGYPPAQ